MSRPRGNRVNSFGDLDATPHRGPLMGNQGDLHNSDGLIGRSWRLKRWISCTLHSPTGHRVAFDTPGRYTPLFFTDVVTALAAGHRPCAGCRRAEYDRFRDGWQAAFGPRATTAEMDETLHQARIYRHGRKVTYEARLSDLPTGVFVTMKAAPKAAHLWRDGPLYPWSHNSYGESFEIAGGGLVTTMTPAPIVAKLQRVATATRPYVADKC